MFHFAWFINSIRLKLFIYTSGQGKGHSVRSLACFFLNCLSWLFQIQQAEKEKGRSLASHKLVAILMTRKQCCFPMCLCSSDSRPIETSWWSSLKIIGPIITFTGNAAMRASKTEIMTAHIGCTAERQSVIMGNFWLCPTHLGGWWGGGECTRKGHFTSMPFWMFVSFASKCFILNNF